MHNWYLHCKQGVGDMYMMLYYTVKPGHEHGRAFTVALIKDRPVCSVNGFQEFCIALQ